MRAANTRVGRAVLVIVENSGFLSGSTTVVGKPNLLLRAVLIFTKVLKLKLTMAAGRILVVEDEDKLRRVVQLHLESLGFEVEGAANAEQALPLAGLAGAGDHRFAPSRHGRHSTDQAIARARRAGGGDCDDGAWVG